MSRPRAHGQERPRAFHQSWVAAVALILMVMAEYKFRLRAQDDTLNGKLDVAVLLEVGMYMIAGAFLFFQLFNPPEVRRSRLVVRASWAFWAVMAVDALYSPYPKVAAMRAGQLAVTVLFGHMIANYASLDHLHRMAHAYAVLVTASIFLGAAVPVRRVGLEAHRFSWLYTHPNIAATFVGASVIVLAFYIMSATRRTWPLSAYIVLLAVNLAGFLAMESRGSIAAAIVGCAVVGLGATRGKRRFDLAVIGAAMAGAGALVFAHAIVAYVNRGGNGADLSTLNSRTSVWSLAWKLITEKPLTGHGFMSARGLFLSTFNLGGAHNALVEVLVNGGFIGAAIWLALLAVLGVEVVATLRKPAHADGPLLAGIFVFLLVNAITAGGLAQAASVQSVWLFTLVGWVAVIRRDATLRGAGPPSGRRPRTATRS